MQLGPGVIFFWYAAHDSLISLFYEIDLDHWAAYLTRNTSGRHRHLDLLPDSTNNWGPVCIYFRKFSSLRSASVLIHVPVVLVAHFVLSRPLTLTVVFEFP